MLNDEGEDRGQRVTSYFDLRHSVFDIRYSSRCAGAAR